MCVGISVYLYIFTLDKHQEKKENRVEKLTFLLFLFHCSTLLTYRETKEAEKSFKQTHKKTYYASSFRGKGNWTWAHFMWTECAFNSTRGIALSQLMYGRTSKICLKWDKTRKKTFIWLIYHDDQQYNKRNCLFIQVHVVVIYGARVTISDKREPGKCPSSFYYTELLWLDSIHTNCGVKIAIGNEFSL